MVPTVKTTNSVVATLTSALAILARMGANGIPAHRAATQNPTLISSGMDEAIVSRYPMNTSGMTMKLIANTPTATFQWANACASSLPIGSRRPNPKAFNITKSTPNPLIRVISPRTETYRPLLTSRRRIYGANTSVGFGSPFDRDMMTDAAGPPAWQTGVLRLGERRRSAAYAINAVMKLWPEELLFRALYPHPYSRPVAARP